MFTDEQQARLKVNEDGSKQVEGSSVTDEAAGLDATLKSSPTVSRAAKPTPSAPTAPIVRLTPEDEEAIKSLNTNNEVLVGEDANTTSSKKLQLLAARSKARQEQLAKRRARRKAAASARASSSSSSSPQLSVASRKMVAVSRKTGPIKPASPYAASTPALSMERPAAKKTRGPPASLIARLSRKTSIPKGASAYGSLPKADRESSTRSQPVGSIKRGRKKKKKKPPTQEEILKQKRKAAKARREKMKEEDKVGFLFFLTLHKFGL